jgi:hypothetical protein
MQFDVLSPQPIIELIELKILPNNQYMTPNIFTHVFSNFKKNLPLKNFTNTLLMLHVLLNTCCNIE